MARQPKQTEPQEQPQEPQESQERPQAKRRTVRVIAKYPPFVDLINDVRIGETPVEVELHPWLEAQIGVGLIIVVK